jgi:hypothetical protein
MKAITIRHPWPWAICYMGKPLENRDWKPSPYQLKPGEKFAIHAGKMPSVVEIRRAFAAMVDMGVIDYQFAIPSLTRSPTPSAAACTTRRACSA